MDLGQPVKALERVFTKPEIGRAAFLLTIVTAALIIDYAAGITHHYTTSQQIDQVQKLNKLAQATPGTASADSLREAIANHINSRQATLDKYQKIGAKASPFLIPIIILIGYIVILTMGVYSDDFESGVKDGLRTLGLFAIVYLAGATLPQAEAITGLLIPPVVQSWILLILVTVIIAVRTRFLTEEQDSTIFRMSATQSELDSTPEDTEPQRVRANPEPGFRFSGD